MAVCNVHFHKPSWFERHGPALLTFAAFAGIVVLAAVLRFWQLGLRTFHDDESIYSLIARQFARTATYTQIPELHGPFQFMLTAGVFKAFGDTDLTARAAPAAFGVMLAVLPFLFMRYIGRPGAIAAALLLAISPTMVYYSRFAGPDIYLAFFTLTTAMVLWRYLVRPSRGYLYLLAMSLAFAVVATEMALAIVPIFLVYLNVRVASAFFAQAKVPAIDASRPPTHYERLGVASGAETRETRLAYKKLVDRTPSRDERELMANAYHVITTVNRREAYDRKLAQRALAADATAATKAQPGAGTFVALLASSWLIAIVWPFAGFARKALNLKSLPDAANPLVVMALLVMPMYGPLAEKLPGVGDRGFSGQHEIIVIGGTNVHPGGELPVMLTTLGVLFAVGLVLGFAWKWHAWVVCWAAFYGITITMFTGFFTDRGGMWTGFWGTLDYWSRPEAPHAAAPAYYYGMMLPVYEFLPLLTIAGGLLMLLGRGGWRDRAIVAGAALAIAGTALVPSSLPYVGHQQLPAAMLIVCAAVLALETPDLTKFLAFWTAAAFGMFSLIGRKDPWLTMHVALPAIMLSARLINDAIAAFEMPAITVPRFRVYAPRRLAQGLVAASVAALAVFTLRTGVLAGWGHGAVPQLSNALVMRDHGDTPIELLTPQANAPDVRELTRAIAHAAADSGQGASVPISLDSSFAFSKGWGWYLRDYPNITTVDMRKPYDAPAGAVVLVDNRNRANVRQNQSALSVTFTKKWSFPGRYAGLSSGDIASRLTSSAAWSDWYAYLSDRTNAGEPDYTEGVALFPRELSASVRLARQSDVLSSAVAPPPISDAMAAPVQVQGASSGVSFGELLVLW
jgi:predicted membrane-bound mannosyltransferase